MVYTVTMRFHFKASRLLAACLVGASLLGSAGGFTGCASTEQTREDPAAIYEQAESNIRNDNYQLAIERFRYLKNKFPYSKYATLASLRIADVYYLQDSFKEAAITYEAFTDLYPRHEKTPYAMFRVGKSYLKDMPDNVARDLTAGERALEAYNAFLERFPNAEEAKEAREDIAQVRNTLASKELYIGDFYARRDQPAAAQNRYRKVIALYPNTPSAEEARKRLERK